MMYPKRLTRTMDVTAVYFTKPLTAFVDRLTVMCHSAGCGLNRSALLGFVGYVYCVAGLHKQRCLSAQFFLYN